MTMPQSIQTSQKYLIGGFNPLKNISQIGSSQLLGKIKIMFQTTNQYIDSYSRLLLDIPIRFIRFHDPSWYKFHRQRLLVHKKQ